MRKSCLNHKAALSYLLGVLCLCVCMGQSLKPLSIDANFKEVNLMDYARENGLVDNASLDFFYFGFDEEINNLDIVLENSSDKEVSLVLELSNALIDELVLLEKTNDTFEEISRTGINYPTSSKAIEHRLFSFNIKLNPLAKQAYRLKLSKEPGKPLVTSILLKRETKFIKDSSFQLTLLGIYYGISFLSICFSLFIAYILKKPSYIVYALYILFLGLYISSYTGLFSQFILEEGQLFNKYTHYALFSEISLLLFVIFSQRILESKTYTPKLKKALDFLLVTIVSIRLLIHFLIGDYFNDYVAIFMNLWYAIFLAMVLIIFIEILVYFKTNFKRSSVFAMAYLFMVSGVFLTILYHSYGLVNTNILGLPLIFYSSLLEILFLTFTVILMVKDIYDERNNLSEKIIRQEKKNLTAFIKGEDQERERIGRELHDNIGSKLGYLKRFVADNIDNNEVNNAIDDICADVRNLSHEISPSDLKLVGFENTILELANKLNKQTSVKVEFNSYDFPGSLVNNTQLQLYRIIQEVLNNALKHSKATHIDIQLIGHQKEATLSIEDNGIGFIIDDVKNGIGLKNIASRVSQINGTLEIDSKPNQGTLTLITFPV